MLQEGDRVIFIGDDSCIIGEIEPYETKLVYGNEYIIFYINVNADVDDDNEIDCCLVTEINTPLYLTKSFMSIKEYYRKQKLQKINDINER